MTTTKNNTIQNARNESKEGYVPAVRLSEGSGQLQTVQTLMRVLVCLRALRLQARRGIAELAGDQRLFLLSLAPPDAARGGPVVTSCVAARETAALVRTTLTRNLHHCGRCFRFGNPFISSL